MNSKVSYVTGFWVRSFNVCCDDAGIRSSVRTLLLHVALLVSGHAGFAWCILCARWRYYLCYRGIARCLALLIMLCAGANLLHLFAHTCHLSSPWAKSYLSPGFCVWDHTSWGMISTNPEQQLLIPMYHDSVWVDTIDMISLNSCEDWLKSYLLDMISVPSQLY